MKTHLYIRTTYIRRQLSRFASIMERSVGTVECDGVQLDSSMAAKTIRLVLNKYLQSDAKNPNIIEITKCQDCRYFDCENNNCDNEMGLIGTVHNDDFCSYGENKE